MPSKAGLLVIVASDLALHEPGERMDSGMKVVEAVARARQWWDARGRKDLAQIGVMFDGERSIPSGILHGELWDRLTKEEKLRVVKAWHHFHVRRPDLLGVDADEKFRLRPDGEMVQ